MDKFDQWYKDYRLNEKLDRLVEARKHERVAQAGFHGDIEKLTTENTNFRKVIYTTKNTQLVLMSLKPGEEIGEEVHEEGSQFFRFESGTGVVYLGNKDIGVSDGSGVVVPQGMKHNVTNTGDEDLKLYALYSPPEHKDGTVNKEKITEARSFSKGKQVWVVRADYTHTNSVADWESHTIGPFRSQEEAQQYVDHINDWLEDNFDRGDDVYMHDVEMLESPEILLDYISRPKNPEARKKVAKKRIPKKRRVRKKKP